MCHMDNISTIDNVDNSLSKDYLHGLIDEGTVAEIDEPEEEPVAHGQNTPRNTPKYQNNPMAKNAGILY